MHTTTPSSVLLLNTIAKPMQFGIYKNGKLLKSFTKEGFASDILYILIPNLIKEYNIEHIIYVNGPGSHMAIKLTYILLKTIELVEKISFSGCSGFTLNNQKPLKAMGLLYFIKEKETIITQRLDKEIEQEFIVPDTLDDIELSESNLPHYVIPAV